MRPSPPLSPRVTVSPSPRGNTGPHPGQITSPAQLATWAAGLKAQTLVAPPDSQGEVIIPVGSSRHETRPTAFLRQGSGRGGTAIDTNEIV